MRRLHRVLYPLLLILGFTWFAWAGNRNEIADVVAVISSDSGPYLEAFQGFKETLGRPVPVTNLSIEKKPEISEQTKVVVAFGGKAALLDYPPDVTVIYCMAPGTKISAGKKKSPVIQIHMYPSARELAMSLKEIQPSLKRLAVFWQSPAYQTLEEEFTEAFTPLGIDVIVQKLSGADEMPQRFRALKGKIDALWIPPDPLLVNAHSFAVIKEFSWANDVPFYSPTAGLTEIGAAAAVSSPFVESGRAAARATRQVLAGDIVQDLYPEKTQITINRTAAEFSGLSISTDTLHRAHRVIP